MDTDRVVGDMFSQLLASSLKERGKVNLKSKKLKYDVVVPRRRSSPRFSRNPDLERLRVQTWFFHVLERAVGAQLDNYQSNEWKKMLGVDWEQIPLARSLQNWLDEQDWHSLSEEENASVPQLAVRRYEEGKSSPREMVLGIFDKFLPDSQVIYDSGLNGEPLWKILDGDLATCKQYVSEAVPLGSGLEEGLDSQFQAVLDALIAPAYRLKTSEIPDLGEIQRSLHPVWLTRINERHRVLNEVEEQNSVLEVASVDDQILAAIALWHLCSESASILVLRLEWLLVGLCYGSIADVFNEPIQDYVLKMLRKNASKIDQKLLQRKVKFSPFEERWKTVHGPVSS